jgi:hypothetical protein
MERIEVNVQTGEVQIIQLTAEEIAAIELQNAAYEAEQSAISPAIDLQARVAELTAELNAIKLKVGA